MKYLEEDELAVNRKYECQLYDGSRLNLVYIGDGEFISPLLSKVVFTFGEVRYVLKLV